MGFTSDEANQQASSPERAETEMEAVRDFYDRIVAYEWSRLDHYVLEFAVTRHYLQKYLPPPPARIVDIGAGPGRYAALLAQQGYDLTVLDLSQRSIEWAKQRMADAGVTAHVEIADARDLSRFAAGTFDAALMMGPLYHLPDEADRRRAVSEMRRVLRPDGLAFTMTLTRAAAIYEGFNRWPEGILDTAGVQRLLTTGSGFNFERDPHDFEGVYFALPDQIQPLHESVGLSTLALVGCEAMLGGRREAIERLPTDVRQAWINLVLQVCEDPSMLGASERLLYVGKAS